MRVQRDFLLKALAAALVCLVVGCSALRLGYANGDSVVYWWLDGYVDFHDEQKLWAREHIGNLFAWHRKTQLKEYGQLFGRLQQRVQAKVTPADVLNDYAALRKRAQLVIDHALPDLADLALSLQPAQLEHLEKKFVSNNESYRKDYLEGDLEHRQRFRFKKVMKQAEYWFGDFSAEQEAQLRAVSDARPLDNEMWMKERVRRQQEMLRMLKKIQVERPSRDVAQAMVKDYATLSFDLFTYDQNPQFFDATRDGMAQVTATMINIATPAQRAHAVKRLQQFIDDCHSLAGK